MSLIKCLPYVEMCKVKTLLKSKSDEQMHIKFKYLLFYFFSLQIQHNQIENNMIYHPYFTASILPISIYISP